MGLLMDENQTTNSSAKQNLFNRLGNPLEWSYVNKTLLLLINQLIVFGAFTCWNWIVLNKPDILPVYIQKLSIDKILHRQLYLLLIYAVMTIFALWLRKKKTDSKLLAYVLAIVISVHGALFLCAIGYATNPLTFLSIFLQAYLGFLLFDKFFSLIILLGWTVSIGIHFVGEQIGVFKYAPSLLSAPFVEGKIDGLWLIWNMGTGIFLTALMLTLSVYILLRWREREAQVTAFSEFLKKMFGRYLSTEVMSSLIEDPSLLELGGERREVTIMMTDLRGFTALSERLPPEKVVELLNTYFEVMVETVLKYNGTINEIIGDALLVIFGAPQEMKDQAERAIACSIEMQNAMTEVNRENRSRDLPDLEMGIGINKAEVIVGNIGSSKRSKYTVVGSGVNMASRIESYTTGGQILVSESAYKDIGNKLRIDGEQEVYPKGSEHPLKIYEIGGIADIYNLILASKDSDLVALSQQIQFQYSIIGGKHIRKKMLEGQIVRLSKTSAEAGLTMSPDLLTNIKMNLLNVEDDLVTKDFYGKVIEQSDGDTFMIRFTSVPPEINSFFQAFRLVASRQ
jgi:class 3 adenylate cyclase